MSDHEQQSASIPDSNVIYLSSYTKPSEHIPATAMMENDLILRGIFAEFEAQKNTKPLNGAEVIPLSSVRRPKHALSTPQSGRHRVPVVLEFPGRV